MSLLDYNLNLKWIKKGFVFGFNLIFEYLNYEK